MPSNSGPGTTEGMGRDSAAPNPDGSMISAKLRVDRFLALGRKEDQVAKMIQDAIALDHL